MGSTASSGGQCLRTATRLDMESWGTRAETDTQPTLNKDAIKRRLSLLRNMSMIVCVQSFVQRMVKRDGCMARR